MRKIAKRGRPPKNKSQTQTKQTKEVSDDQKLYELCGMVDYITQYSQSSSITDISLTTLYDYLKNPYRNIKYIRNASKYLINKHGILKEVLLAFRNLPTLNYHLNWSNFSDPKRIIKYEKKIYDFLEEINVKKLVRDGLYEVGELGTVIPCLRKEKYVQFLELDDLRINSQINGKWKVEYDLSTIKQTGMYAYDILTVIESLPEEITTGRFNLYQNKGEDHRYVTINNCDVINYGGNRNYPWGLPLTLGAWASLLQKEIINRVERSVSDRLIKQILILYAGTIGGDKTTPGSPVPKDLLQHYFDNLKNLLLKKEQNSLDTNSTDLSGTGLATLPDFLKLEPLKVDVTMFTKDLYQKINNDIFMNLGISASIIYGGAESSYSSADLNSYKFFRNIFSVLEQFEDVINVYIKGMLPANLSCKFYFDRVTIVNKDKYVEQCEKFYMQTGIFTPWAEALFGIPYHYILGMSQYEQEVLKLKEKIQPPQNAFTQSGNSGRPNDDSSTNPNTQKSKNNGSNNLPSPSD